MAAYEQATLSESAPHRYDLPRDEFDELQAVLVGVVKAHFDKEGVYNVWHNPDSELSNLVRTEEMRWFKGIDEIVTAETEKRSRFLTIVDTRGGTDRVVHATRASGPAFSQDFEKQSPATSNAQDRTHMIIVDELVESAQGFTAQDFNSYYRSRDRDLDHSLSVETNFTVGERVRPFSELLRISDLAYISLYKKVRGNGFDSKERYMFAFANDKTIRSLIAVNVDCRPLAGRVDLRVPDGKGGYDPDFKPVEIPMTAAVRDTFEEISRFGAEELWLDSQ